MLKNFKLGGLASYGIAYTLSAAVQKGIGFLVFMYFANIFSTAEYAKFGINYSIFTVVSALAFSGIIESVISLMREHKTSNSLNELFKAANSVFVVLSLVSTLLVSFIIYVIYRNNYIHSYEILIIVFGALVSSYFIFQSTIIRLEERHALSILLLFIPSIIGYSVGLVAVLFFRTEMSYFYGTLLAYLFSSLILILFTKKRVNGFSINRIFIFQIASRIAPYIVIALLGWLLGYGNTFLVKYLFDDMQVASFIFLLTISSILQLVATSMNQVWSPRFFSNYEVDSLQTLEGKNRKFTILQGITLGVVGAGIILIFPFLVNHFQKLQKFGDSKVEMFFLYGGYIISIPWWHAQNYFMIDNKGKSLMNLTVISGFIGYVIWIICMIVIGPTGIYLGFFVQMFIRSLIVFFKARSYWKINFDWEGIAIGMAILLLSLVIT